MKKLILFSAFIFISFPSFSDDKVYHIIQSWQATGDNHIRLNSYWADNSFSTLSLCEKNMLEEVYIGRAGKYKYEITTIETLNLNLETEERTTIYIRRDNGTIQVQFNCVDFKK